MTMMATQEQTDPSVLLNRKSLKDTMANVDDDDDRSDDIPVVEPLPPQLEDKYGPKTSRTSTADASSSNNYNTMMSMTPPRSSLANDPNLTPIASIKRPRANLNRTNSANRSTGTMMMMSPKTPSDAISRRSSTSGTVVSTPLSPMHKIKPVLHRETAVASENHHEDIKDKVDELFSPVVQFLHDHEDSHLHDHSNANNDICNIPHASKSEDVDVTEDDDDESMCRPEQHDGNDGEFNPWQFIASLPPYEMVVSQRPPVTLPPPSTGTPRKTLVLDLDETLVHCSVVEPTDRVADFTFPVQFHGETYTVHVKCRPYLHEFLEMASRHFEVIVFTASQKVYADALLNIIDPSKFLAKPVLFLFSSIFQPTHLFSLFNELFE
jgi:TFIIF-interacting CTD phosphatase-like protein